MNKKLFIGIGALALGFVAGATKVVMNRKELKDKVEDTVDDIVEVTNEITNTVVEEIVD